MFDQIQYDAWMMTLSEYFIKNYGYQIVAMPKNVKEVWLANPNRETDRIVMISSLSVDEFNLASIENHRRVLAQVYSSPLDGLNISVNQTMSETDEYNVVVGPASSSVSPHLSQFENIQSVLKVSSNPQKALQKAVHSLNRLTQKKQRQGLRKMIPLTTAITALVTIVYFLLVGFTSFKKIDFTLGAVMFGAYYKPLIVGGNEWFRLLTAGFLHADVFHLLMNVFALNMIARVAEPVLGKWKYMALLLLGIITGNLFVFIRNEATVGVGLSGGIFALMGWLVVYLFESGAFQNKKLRNEIISTLAINVMISMMPNISFMAHLGGFITGVFFAVIVSKHKDWELNRKAALIMSVIMIATMGFMTAKNSDYETLPALDTALIASWYELGFENYAFRLFTVLK